MEEGGQYQRLLLALVLFVGELGAFLLLGSLSVGVILAQVLLLLLLAFARWRWSRRRSPAAAMTSSRAGWRSSPATCCARPPTR